MPAFSDIVGHEDTVAHLRTSVAQGKIHHAYIFQGAPGSGKRTLADAFAQALQCENTLIGGGDLSKTDACGTCRACHQALGKNHPDIIYVTHEKEQIISVGEIREQLVGDIDVRPYNGKYKIYIVADAQKMNVQAQNALLKTLEEPPEYAVILLLSTNSATFLDTIRSRCVLLNLKPVRDDQVMHYLMEHMEIPDYQAKLCASFAQGSIGRAMALAGSEEFQDLRYQALRVASHIGGMDVHSINEQVNALAEKKERIDDFLDILGVWMRDVLLFKATRDPDSLIFRDQLQAVSRAASVSSYEGIEAMLRALDTAKTRLKANVNFELTMELLLLTLRDYS